MSEIEIKPAAKDDFSRTITKENKRPAEILKNLQLKAISRELSQKKTKDQQKCFNPL